MFTGLVQAKNRLLAQRDIEGGRRLTFSHEFSELSLGESIAVSGVCLTVVSFDPATFDVELSSETLRLTTLGSLQAGDSVNMERALRVGDRLGGHLVSGHVDGVSVVVDVEPEGDMKKVTLRIPEHLSAYMAQKGSLTVDGVSLTVNSASESEVKLHIIPHTLVATTLGCLMAGQQVNIEVDLIARYVERLVQLQPGRFGA